MKITIVWLRRAPTDRREYHHGATARQRLIQAATFRGCQRHAGTPTGWAGLPRSCRGFPAITCPGSAGMRSPVSPWRLWPSPPRWATVGGHGPGPGRALRATRRAGVVRGVRILPASCDRPDLDGGADVRSSGRRAPGHEDPGRAIALSSGVALVAGLWLALFGILRLGWVTDFISRPVIVGFSFGLGLVVIAGELPHMLGVPSPSGHFAQRVWTTLGELGQTSPLTVALAVGGLALLFLGDARRPTIPWALLLMGIGVVLARTWNPADHGIEMIGSVPRGLPTFEVPALGLSDIEPLLLGGLAVAVAAVGEGLSLRLESSRTRATTASIPTRVPRHGSGQHRRGTHRRYGRAAA